MEGLKAVAFFVAWPGLVGVSTFVLMRAARFHVEVNRQPVGRLVLLMVVGSVITWAALAGFATYELVQRDEAAAIVFPLFLLWAGSMVLITWIMHRWGEEAVQINLYHVELARMDEMKAQLINTVAHEINTPLTPIRFRVSTIKAGGFGEVSVKQVDALESIERNLDRVDSIVAKMVLAVQFQTGKVQVFLTPTELDPIIADVAGRMGPLAAEKGVLLDVGADGLMARGDPKQLMVAFEALLSNAVKFTPRGGRVTVRTVREGGRVRVAVSDTGIGLTPEAKATLFQPLRQTHDTMQVTESGAGLGLYICQAIARLHGGHVDVESAGPGQGSTFTLVLPAA